MRKFLVCVVMICILCTILVLPAYAKVPGSGTVQEEFGGGEAGGTIAPSHNDPTIYPYISTSKVIGGLIDDVCQVARYIGFIQFAVGLVMYIMAYKDDHPESITRAARMMVIGAILLSLKPLLKTAKLIR